MERAKDTTAVTSMLVWFLQHRGICIAGHSACWSLPRAAALSPITQHGLWCHSPAVSTSARAGLEAKCISCSSNQVHLFYILLTYQNTGGLTILPWCGNGHDENSMGITCRERSEVLCSLKASWGIICHGKKYSFLRIAFKMLSFMSHLA